MGSFPFKKNCVSLHFHVLITGLCTKVQGWGLAVISGCTVQSRLQSTFHGSSELGIATLVSGGHLCEHIAEAVQGRGGHRCFCFWAEAQLL